VTTSDTRSGSTVTTDTVYDFKITFLIVSIKVFNPVPFVLNNTRSQTLAKEHLFAWTFPRSSAPAATFYVLTAAPTYGILYRIIDPIAGRNRRIGQYANFTQQHVNDGRIFYELHQLHYTTVKDSFRFKVFVETFFLIVLTKLFQTGGEPARDRRRDDL
jgi:hypothetical protein